jgi:hypothetical protein
MGASNEKRGDHLEGVCEEDKLDRGGGDFGDELSAFEAGTREV